VRAENAEHHNRFKLAASRRLCERLCRPLMGIRVSTTSTFTNGADKVNRMVTFAREPRDNCHISWISNRHIQRGHIPNMLKQYRSCTRAPYQRFNLRPLWQCANKPPTEVAIRTSYEQFSDDATFRCADRNRPRRLIQQHMGER
jgi:hypothetical protein